MEWISVPMLRDEAVVLFEWLASNEDTSIAALPPAERTVLLWILARLEETLVEPSMPDYRDRVQAARRRIIDVGVRPQSPSPTSPSSPQIGVRIPPNP